MQITNNTKTNKKLSFIIFCYPVTIMAAINYSNVANADVYTAQTIEHCKNKISIVENKHDSAINFTLKKSFSDKRAEFY